jgi:hypothetical protein
MLRTPVNVFGVWGSSARGAAVESAATKRTSRVKSEIMMNLISGIEFEVWMF